MHKCVLFNLIVMLGFASCIDSRKEKLKEKLNSYVGRNIILPFANKSEFGKIKIVTYINGNCGVCVNDLEKWKSWMEKDTIMIDYFFYLHVMDSASFSYIESEVVDLDYPIIYDQGKDYLKLNGLSEESKLFQTFLLNESNQVILVGSPHYNIKLAQMYRREIGRLANNNCQVGQ